MKTSKIYWPIAILVFMFMLLIFLFPGSPMFMRMVALQTWPTWQVLKRGSVSSTLDNKKLLVALQ